MRDPEHERTLALRSAPVVMVSACLLGESCRYDGKHQRSEKVLAALAGKAVVPVCPEAAAGLGIPRPAVELRGGDGEQVLAGDARARQRETGGDASAQFVAGAGFAVEAAARFGATVALLKERSPSCGSRQVWIDGQLRPGRGVAAAALETAGIPVVSDEEL
ncbi:MAG: DUF523 domain-containing protein [Myxococcota bacterium]|nr:DUF523 domain-containing protein [Myxococcota bacterium]